MKLRRTDSLSKETAYAGYPKACKVRLDSSGQLAPTSGVFTVMVFDKTPLFNYGPFTFRANGASYIDGVIVNEPGIYRAVGQVLIVANTQMFLVQLGVNGVGQNDYADTGATLSNGTFGVVHQVQGYYDLKAGDYISLHQVQTTSAGGPTASGAGGTWLYVEKLGGQY